VSATTTIAAPMNTAVAAIERTDSLAMPHTPWPEVQPLASRVPKPTSRPAAITTTQLGGMTGAGIGSPAHAPAAIAAARRQPAGNPADAGDPPGQQHQQHGRQPDQRTADRGGEGSERGHGPERAFAGVELRRDCAFLQLLTTTPTGRRCRDEHGRAVVDTAPRPA
jgi:hypothetical protein